MSAEQTTVNPRVEPAARRGVRIGWAAVTAAILLSGSADTANAQPSQDQVLIQCSSTISLDKRLLMEQWASPGGCERPIRTRVTDRFLGFTCLEHAGGSNACRSYTPGPDSEAFNTAKSFRCVDFGVTERADGIGVSRMREWAAVPKQCDWDPYAGVLASEIDFDNGQVCIAAMCMAVDRLSAIGKVRLRELVASAMRDLGLTAQAEGPHAVYPVRAGSK